MHKFLAYVPDQCRMVPDRMSIRFGQFNQEREKEVKEKLSLFNVTMRDISIAGRKSTGLERGSSRLCLDKAKPDDVIQIQKQILHQLVQQEQDKVLDGQELNSLFLCQCQGDSRKVLATKLKEEVQVSCIALRNLLKFSVSSC